jgi:hypothetical protein
MNSFPCGMVLDNAVVIAQDPRLSATVWDSPSGWDVTSHHHGVFWSDLDHVFTPNYFDFHGPAWWHLQTIFSKNYWFPTWESDLYRPVTTLSYWLNYGINHRSHPAVLWVRQWTTARANGMIDQFNFLIDCAHRWFNLPLDYQLAHYDPPRAELTSAQDGLEPAGFHFVNLLLHWANALMVFVLARRILASSWAGLWVSAVFAVHPLGTESVTNIVGRADLLATLAILLGLQLHLRACAASGLRRAGYLTLLTVVSLVGMFCKESAVVVVGVMGLYDISAPRAQPGQSQLAAIREHFARGAWLSYVFVVPCVIALFFVRLWFFHDSPVFDQIFADNPTVHANFWHSRMTAVGVLGGYLRLCLWPATLSCDYSYNQVPLFGNTFHGFDRSCWVSLMILGAMLALSLWAWRRKRPLFFFLALFAGTILPVANVLMLIGTIMAERVMYLPMLGIIGAVAVVVPILLHKTGLPAVWRAGLLAAAGVVVVVGMSVRTFYRNVDWVDDMHLWTSAVKACPNSYKVYQALATAIYQTDRQSLPVIDSAIAVARQGLTVLDHPRLPPLDVPGLTYRNLGVYYMSRADALTLQYSAMTVGIQPGNAAIPGLEPPSVPPEVQAQIDAGYQFAADGLEWAVVADHAVNEKSRAFRSKKLGKRPEEIPDVGTGDTYRVLGALRMHMRQWDKAAADFAYMRRLSPRDPQGYDLNAGACIAQGQYDQAGVLQIQFLILGGVASNTYTRLTEIYQRLSAPPGAVTLMADGRVTLNSNNPVVRQQVIRAYAGLIEAIRRYGQPQMAEQLRQQAIDTFNCPPSLLDSLRP